MCTQGGAGVEIGEKWTAALWSRGRWESIEGFLCCVTEFGCRGEEILNRMVSGGGFALTV